MSVPSQFFSELRIRQFLTIAGYTIFAYDYLLTLDLEVDYIWFAPWNSVKVIFLLNRYGTLIGQLFLALEELGMLSHGSRKFCAIFGCFQSLLVLFSSETTRILLLIRAWSLWRCSYRFVISLVSFYVFYVLVLGGFTSYILINYLPQFDFPYLDETGICVFSATVEDPWLLGLFSLLLDTGMFAVIAYYLYKLCEGLQHLQHSPLLRLLVRDAVLFYVVSVFYDVLVILSLSVFVDGPLYLIQSALTFPLLTIAGQRVVLNLRGFRSRSYTTQYISRFVDRRIAAMQRPSLWQSFDLWMSDVHQEMELDEEQSRSRTRTTGSQVAEEENSHELMPLEPAEGTRSLRSV